MSLFVLIAVVPQVRAKDFLWSEVNSIVSLDLPAGWAEEHKAYGDSTFTCLIKPDSRKNAEMILSLIQSVSPASGSEKDVEVRLRRFVTNMLKSGQAYNIMNFPRAQGIARMSQFSRDAMAPARVPFTHPILRVALCPLDAHCDLIAIMQMDDANSAEAEVMAGIVSSTALTRHKSSGSLEIVLKDDHYVLSVPAGQLRLKFPRGGLVQNDARMGGATNNPRYFDFFDLMHGFQVSGWFEHASRYKGIREFWASEKAANRLKPKHDSFDRCGDWEVVYYEVLDGKQPNIRAEYVRADTWIDLHCSITGPENKAKAKQALLDFIRSLTVETKEPDPVSPPPKLDQKRLSDLKSALADLTTNIEQADDKRFAEAAEIMAIPFAGRDPAELNFSPDCLVWEPPPPKVTMTFAYLNIAFMAAVIQERVSGDSQLALYRGWKCVIKYYQHYHAEGGLPKLDSIEKLIAAEKAGTLQKQADQT